jgi:hypothetical protein
MNNRRVIVRLPRLRVRLESMIESLVESMVEEIQRTLVEIQRTLVDLITERLPAIVQDDVIENLENELINRIDGVESPNQEAMSDEALSDGDVAVNDGSRQSESDGSRQSESDLYRFVRADHWRDDFPESD